jgi:hypothetical protein
MTRRPVTKPGLRHPGNRGGRRHRFRLAAPEPIHQAVHLPPWPAVVVTQTQGPQGANPASPIGTWQRR